MLSLVKQNCLKSLLLKNYLNCQYLKAKPIVLKSVNKKEMNELSVSKKNKVALVACGSFNPITYMHLRMFELAKDYLNEAYPNVEVSKGILSPVSDYYGKSELVAGCHRKKMCQLAVNDYSWVEVGTWELEQSEWMPAVKVLKHYEEYVLKNQIADKTMLLCGADILHSFSTKDLWLESDIRKIIQHHGIIVISRPSHNIGDIISTSKLLLELKSHVHVVAEHFANATSATSIRQAIKNKKSIKFLIPDPVIDYIKTNDLYKCSPTNSNSELAPLKKYRNNQ